MSPESDDDLLLLFLGRELSDDEEKVVDLRLRREPALAGRLLQLAIDEGSIVEWAQGSRMTQRLVDSVRCDRSLRQPLRWLFASSVAVALLIGLGLGSWVTACWRTSAVTAPVVAQDDSKAEPPVAILKGSAGAEFADAGMRLPLGAAMEAGVEYILRKGMVQVQFSSGPTVIVTAPAVFSLQGPLLMYAGFGEYSVDVPKGAEGFRIDCPAGRVKDLGTRFSLHVAETGQADVQMVDGEAEVHRDGDVASHLTTGQALQLPPASDRPTSSIPFDPSRYRSGLPDRVVSYAAREIQGGVEDLISVTVQRGGRPYLYRAGEFTGIEVIHFHGGLPPVGTKPYHLAQAGNMENAPAELSPLARRNLLEGDFKLTTGLVNLGGAQQPLISDPVMGHVGEASLTNTPGMAIRFRQPVINAPGPDVVLFDVQMSTNPPEGDAFHVAPLRFEPGRHAHTVKRFDIDMNSLVALRAAPIQC